MPEWTHLSNAAMSAAVGCGLLPAAPANTWPQRGQIDTCPGGAGPQQLRSGKKSKGKTFWHGWADSV